MAAVAHLGRAVLVDYDDATVVGEVVANLGDGRGRLALDRRQVDTVAEDRYF